MRDDFYCHNVYNYFKQNCLLNLRTGNISMSKPVDQLLKEVLNEPQEEKPVDADQTFVKQRNIQLLLKMAD